VLVFFLFPIYICSHSCVHFSFSLVIRTSLFFSFNNSVWLTNYLLINLVIQSFIVYSSFCLCSFSFFPESSVICFSIHSIYLSVVFNHEYS
jgi:hypothetical protein